MKAYSEDLRKKIVDAVERRGMNNCQAARTFDVSLSTVKRYMRKSRRGISLSPGKAPGRRPRIEERARKLLEEDIEKRPAITLQERCEYLYAVGGMEISRSALCRTIKKMERTRKKGHESPPSATSSAGRPGG